MNNASVQVYKRAKDTKKLLKIAKVKHDFIYAFCKVIKTSTEL